MQKMKNKIKEGKPQGFILYTIKEYIMYLLVYFTFKVYYIISLYIKS